jgi:hypothetical protein
MSWNTQLEQRAASAAGRTLRQRGESGQQPRRQGDGAAQRHEPGGMEPRKQRRGRFADDGRPGGSPDAGR